MSSRVTYGEAHKLWLKRHEEEKQKLEKVEQMNTAKMTQSLEHNIPGVKSQDSDNDDDDSDNDQ